LPASVNSLEHFGEFSAQAAKTSLLI